MRFSNTLGQDKENALLLNSLADRKADHAQARSALSLDAHSQILIFGTESDTDPDLYVNLIGRSADEVRRAS